jgi:hypothetical protein
MSSAPHSKNSISNCSSLADDLAIFNSSFDGSSPYKYLIFVLL